MGHNSSSRKQMWRTLQQHSPHPTIICSAKWKGLSAVEIPLEKMKKEKVRREEVEREKESMTPDYGPNGVVQPESGPGTGNPDLPSPFHNHSPAKSADNM